MKRRITSILLWVVLICVSGIAPRFCMADEGLCARVKIEIRQEITLERQAFDAHMRINNGLTHLPIEDVSIDVTFTDEDGAAVSASSDPDNPDALFYIRVDTLENIDDVSGTGTVDPASFADIHWLIIPAPGAAREAVDGTIYYVGATLSYTLGGETNVTVVKPDFIFVKPMPELSLDYFLPAEVYGDDPFTSEVEPPTPFSLGLRVSNNGYGTARNLKIDSAIPRIVDNDQGLLIGFTISGSEVDGEDRSDTLLADLGDLGPGGTSAARWTMNCTLSGRFVDFSAELTHADELGGELTSLVQSTNSHLLVRDVLVDIPGRDTIRDFLAKDDDIFRVYESNGLDTVVEDVSSNANMQPSADAMYSVSAQTGAGFVFLKLPVESEFAAADIETAVRSDGKYIKPENIWISKTRNAENGWDFFINLFDCDSTGEYLISVSGVVIDPRPPVLQYIPDKTGMEGEMLSFIVQATDPNGTIPDLTIETPPVGAGFNDRGDGTGVFEWIPDPGQYGKWSVRFIASDGELRDAQSVGITIAFVDSDGDGMADSWEMANFGSLERDGSGDFDGDGIPDLDEFLQGSDPTRENYSPPVPQIVLPSDGSEIRTLNPTLTVTTKPDPDGDPVTCDFEIYADAAYTAPVETEKDIPSGTGETEWSISNTLDDNTWYFWRVLAKDDFAESTWAYGKFFTNTTNDSPGAPVIDYPENGSVTDSLLPEIRVINGRDMDGDALFYDFEVFSDAAMTIPAASASGVPENSGGTTAWTVDTELMEGRTFYFRVTAVDEHGARSDSVPAHFTVDTSQPFPDPPMPVSPTGGEVVNAYETDLVIANSGAPTYDVQLDTSPEFPNPLTWNEIPEEVGTISVRATGLSDDTWYYWRARSVDGTGKSNWVLSRFFANPENDPPSIPHPKNPIGGAWVDSAAPILSVHKAEDPDLETPIYYFEIYSDPELTQIIATGQSPDPEWKTDEKLSDNTRYYWRSRAGDPNGVFSEWSETESFFVKISPPDEISVYAGMDSETPLEGIKVYAFSDSETYTGLSGTTDADGNVSFQPEDFEEGTYKFRIDYLGHRFWSDPAPIPEITEFRVFIPHETRTVHVQSVTGPWENVRVYLFTETGSYLGISDRTDENGEIQIDLPVGAAFKFRADILGGRYWSDSVVITAGDSDSIIIDAGGGTLQLSVIEQTDEPLPAIKTYLFSESGSYLGLSAATDAAGLVTFRIPEGVFKVRADYLGYRFWTDPISVGQDLTEYLVIEHRDIRISVRTTYQGSFQPLEDTKTYLFSETGSYLGRNGATDENGEIVYHLPVRAYKIRADYLGGRFWSDPFTGEDAMVTISEGIADVYVRGASGGIPDTKVYLFSAQGAYLGVSGETDATGVVEFQVPEGDFRFRADHLGTQYWGESHIPADIETTVDINTGGGDFEVTVDSDGTPISGIPVYVFSDAGSYLGLHGVSETDGRVLFELSDGPYRFRADYLGYRFWSDTTIVPDTFSASIPIPRTEFVLTVKKGDQVSEPIPDVPVYLFSSSGSYLGQKVDTNAQGEAVFLLPEREYKFRADYMGYRFFTPEFDIGTESSGELVIPHRETTVSVFGDYPVEHPFSDVKVYLFNPAGSYLGQYRTTDEYGEAVFLLPEMEYKIRADYLGQKFWSDLFQGIDPDIGISEGVARVHAVRSGEDIPDARVYLFSETGSYLGRFQTTDPAGLADFVLPDRTFKFRVDENGHRYWSPVVEISPGITATIDVELN